MSRQNISRSDQVFKGRATYALYQADKPGLERTLYFRWRPGGKRTVTFTGALAAGATSGTLSGNWGGTSGLFPITFSDGEVLLGLFTNGATTCTFWPATAPITGGSYGVGGATGSAGQAALNNAVTSAATAANQPPVLGTSNAYGLTQSVSSGVAGLINGAIVTAGVGTPDVPRNVIGAWTGTAILTVVGTDYYGAAQTESSASGTSFTGKKAFATITSYSFNANVTSATLGSGNVLGLPYRIASGDLVGMTFNDAADAGTIVLRDLTLPATATTGDVRGTYAPAGTLNGAKVLTALILPADDTTQVGSFGVTPA